jgi:hypothetical protein
VTKVACSTNKFKELATSDSRPIITNKGNFRGKTFANSRRDTERKYYAYRKRLTHFIAGNHREPENIYVGNYVQTKPGTVLRHETGLYSLETM